MKLGDEWLKRVKYAKRVFSDHIEKWQANEDLFKGEKRFYSIDDEALIYYVNLYKQNQKTMRSQSVPTDVDFYVTKKGDPDPTRTAILSAVARDKAKRGILKALPKVSTDAFTSPYGVVMVDYRYDRELDEIVEPDPLKLEMDGVEDYSQSQITKIVTEENIEIIVRVVDPKDFLYDPFCRDVNDDARWFARKVYIPKDEFMDDDRFTHKEEVVNAMDNARSKGEASTADTGSSDQEMQDDDHRRVEIWEIWDVRKRMTYYMADGLSYILQKKKWDVKSRRFKHPFCIMSFVMDESHDNIPYQPIMSDLHSMHDEYNMLRDIEQRDAGRKVRKFIAKAGSLDQEEQVKMEAPYEHSVVFVKDTVPDENRPVRDILSPVSENPVPMDVDFLLSRCMSDMQQVIGYGPGDRGGMPRSKTATESIHLRDMLSGRSQILQASVMEFVEEVVRKALIILSEKMTGTEYINLSATGSPSWTQVTKDMLSDRIEVSVIPGVKNMKNRAIRTNQLMTVIRLLAEMQGRGMPMNVMPVIEEVMEMFDFSPAATDRIFSNQKQIALEAAKTIASLGGNLEFSPEQAQYVIGLLMKLMMTVLTQEDLAMIQNEKDGNVKKKRPDTNVIRGPGSNRNSQASDGESGIAGGLGSAL